MGILVSQQQFLACQALPYLAPASPVRNMQTWVRFSLLLSFVPAISACWCNGYTSESGGECTTEYQGRSWCYVEAGDCWDETKGTSSDRLWSFQACEHRINFEGGGYKQCAELDRLPNTDFGGNYLGLESKSSLSECLDECLFSVDCDAITWDKYAQYDNCALYESFETYEEAREGYDSYYCKEVQAASGGWIGNQATAATGIGGFIVQTIGAWTYGCEWPYCRARSGQCCLRPLHSPWCPWSC